MAIFVSTVGMLDKEFKYYIEHQADIVKNYNGKFVIIKDEQIINAFSSEQDAYNEAYKKFEPGTFLIQLVSPGTDNYTQTFHSRVAF